MNTADFLRVVDHAAGGRGHRQVDWHRHEIQQG
jgi:hypothetical protein